MRNNKSLRSGQAAALVTILIWGTTFISTKVLLNTLSPVEILFLRFGIGYLALWLAAPRRLRLTEGRQEAYSHWLDCAALPCIMALKIWR